MSIGSLALKSVVLRKIALMAITGAAILAVVVIVAGQPIIRTQSSSRAVPPAIRLPCVGTEAIAMLTGGTGDVLRGSPAGILANAIAVVDQVEEFPSLLETNASFPTTRMSDK